MCDSDRTFAIWHAAVLATHGFLTAQDFADIKSQVREFLSNANLWLAVDYIDWPQGFIGLTENHIDALFVDPSFSGMGIGQALIKHAAENHEVITTDVNEQNWAAYRFYERIGVIPIGRSPNDP